MSRWTKFLRRSGREQLLCVEALAGLCWDLARLRVLPFRRIAAGLGRAQVESPHEIDADARRVAVDVSWAVQAVARHSPVRFVCLPQALTASRMLRRRGVPSTLYLGVAFERSDRAALLAHAWLRAGDKFVTGEREALRHRSLACFTTYPRA